MNFKRIIAGVLALAMAGSLVGCKKGKGENTSSVAEKKSAEYEAVKSAVDKLREYKEDYIITNAYSLPQGTDYYLEIKTKDGTYREYPVVDEETEITAEEAADTTYSLFDWVTTDNKAYLINPEYKEGDATSTYWISTPDEYGVELSERNVLFLDTFLEASSNWKSLESADLDIGTGTVTLDMYSCTVTSDSVAEVLGVDTLSLYKCLKKKADKDKDENMSNLTKRYIEDLTKSLTFSEGTLTIGVYDGMVRYMELGAGGLGSNMYLTKTVMSQNNFEVRSLPDFTSVTSYYDTAKDLADYVAKYDSYEEAMRAMSEDGGVLSTDLDLEEGTETDSDAETGEESAAESEQTNSSADTSVSE